MTQYSLLSFCEDILYLPGRPPISCLIFFLFFFSFSFSFLCLFFCLLDFHICLAFRKTCAFASVPLKQWSRTFLAPGTSFVEGNFPMDLGVEGGFRMIQAHYIYCALYFYYYYINSSSDHQALDLRGWGSLLLKHSFRTQFKLFWLTGTHGGLSPSLSMQQGKFVQVSEYSPTELVEINFTCPCTT